jgi:hypothetical protein
MSEATSPSSNEAQYANFIPDAVRRQSLRADEISQQVYHSPVEEEPAAAEAPAPEHETPPPAAEAPVAQPAPAAVEEDFRAKYLTLQGKYNAEVPALRTQVEALQRIIQNMQQHQQQQTEQAKPETTTVVDPKDIEEFGEDLVNKSRKWARAEMQGEFDKLNQKFTELQQNQAQSAQQAQMNQAQALMQSMDNDSHWGQQTDQTAPTDGRHERWRVVNEDPKFLEWLQQHDVFTGHKRLLQLRDAFTSGQHSRFKAFFEAFAREQTATQAAPQTHSTDTPAQEPVRPSLEQFAMPGRNSGPATPGAPADKILWTNASIAAFYRDCNKGLYRNKEPERARLEADLVAAAREGRVKP